MNGIKHELVGSTSAATSAAVAAAYQNPLLYAPTPSWMSTENFPGKSNFDRVNGSNIVLKQKSNRFDSITLTFIVY
jgi:hypothetical protein